LAVSALLDEERQYDTKACTLIGGLSESSEQQCIVRVKMVAKACRNFLTNHFHLFQNYFSPHVQQLFLTNRVQHKSHPTLDESKRKKRMKAREKRIAKNKKAKAERPKRSGYH